MVDRTRCPVCGARLRAARECSRCGADLGILMGLQAAAFRLRLRARTALRQGDFEAAWRAAREAQLICFCLGGRRLEALAHVLVRAKRGSIRAPGLDLDMSVVDRGRDLECAVRPTRGATDEDSFQRAD